MKLSATQVTVIKEKTGLKPLTDEVAVESGLSGFFGENSFYVDDRGVYVFEEADGAVPADPEGALLTAIQIASVEPAEGKAVTVRSIEPRTTQLVVEIV